jgi:Uma2 family endonuclease
MATTTYIPIEAYLRMSTEPDCEYVDGQIEERSMPEYDHATWQGAILLFLSSHGKSWGVRSRTELRTRVAPSRVRVPDVAVLSRSAPIEQIVITPPLAVFEVLSPEDSLRGKIMMRKLADYEKMGIAGIWIIDPKKTIAYGYKSGELETVTELGLPSLGITFTLEDIAAFID